MTITPITAFRVGTKIFVNKADAEIEVKRQDRKERIIQFLCDWELQTFYGDLLAEKLAQCWDEMKRLIP